MKYPKHSLLPLWHNKNLEEKLETLHDLIMDLYQYTLAEARNDVLNILYLHKPEDEKEAHDIVKITEFVKTYPNIFNKNCEPGHLTGSALIVNPRDKTVLLHLHKKLNKWLQFGGHADYETDLANVALREAKEETGLPDLAFHPSIPPFKPLDIDMHLIPQKGDIPEHYHLDFRYLLTTYFPNQLSVDEYESDTFIWIPFSEISLYLDKIDGSLLRLIKKAEHFFQGENSNTKLK